MSEPRATRREWIGLAVIALPCMLYSMDLTVLNLALPALAADLEPSGVQLLWIIDVYGFLVAGALLTMGTLGDRVGRRRLLLIGAVVFGAASLLAAFAPSAGALIAARALLGLAGATIAPSTLSLIRNMFHDPQQRAFAIGIWISSYSAGAAIGPLLGGMLLEFFWWGSVFLLALPVMVLLLAVGPFLLPEYRDPDAGRIDLPSAALSLVAVLSLIFGLKEAAQNGFGVLSTASVALSAVLGLVFVTRQKSLADPLIDLSLFRAPAFSLSLGIYLTGTFISFGVFIFMTQYLLVVLGLSPFVAGLWTAPFAIGFIVGSMLAPRLARRWTTRGVMAAGLALAALGYLMITQVHRVEGAWLLMLGMVVQSLGMAPLFTLTNDLILGAAPPERAGAASGISETASELGGALGIALLGTLATAIFGAALAPHTVLKSLQLSAALSVAVLVAMVLVVLRWLPRSGTATDLNPHSS